MKKAWDFLKYTLIIVFVVGYYVVMIMAGNRSNSSENEVQEPTTKEVDLDKIKTDTIYSNGKGYIIESYIDTTDIIKDIKK